MYTCHILNIICRDLGCNWTYEWIALGPKAGVLNKFPLTEAFPVCGNSKLFRNKWHSTFSSPRSPHTRIDTRAQTHSHGKKYRQADTHTHTHTHTTYSHRHTQSHTQILTGTVYTHTWNKHTHTEKKRKRTDTHSHTPHILTDIHKATQILTDSHTHTHTHFTVCLAHPLYLPLPFPSLCPSLFSPSLSLIVSPIPFLSALMLLPLPLKKTNKQTVSQRCNCFTG